MLYTGTDVCYVDSDVVTQVIEEGWRDEHNLPFHSRDIFHEIGHRP